MTAATALENRAAFTSVEVCKLTGCSFRQLDYWVRRGLVQELVAANGSGSRRLVGGTELDVITVAVVLLNAGFVLEKAFEYGRQLMESGEPVVAAGGLVRIGGAL